MNYQLIRSIALALVAVTAIASEDVCINHITNYNICIQSAQLTWRRLEMAREYCCLLLDIRECRRLLRYELCEDQAQNHSVTTLLHDQLRKELSKILLIGDVCEVYQSRSNCSADFWSFALTATILLLCVASVSYGLIKYSRLKQMTNQATIGNQQSG